ncbi:uncharacterized protein BYT42DRAFT_531385 [Radiomyces spectabilis]|uniref:uncharacterized protein n=1 Tax=Radiomyces spectabilis TaxID=64574 RepID=UPI00222095A6|nr:uncharacterized protein BYT42DRAFT_531385 [Radiomyces spectabilis]KAI8381491.1 hypothetical protein BYT42DRAFT_531385 [Radiomyces spectabilis]
MMEDPKFFFDDSTPELRLVNATELIKKNGDHNQVLKALTFLRYKAANNDTEAKTKLSTLYAETQSDLIQQDAQEAHMWSRSIFDKQLSAALQLAAPHLLDASIKYTSTVALILEQANPDYPKVCYLAGLLLLKGIGTEQDIKRGVSYLQVAAETQVEAAYELGCYFGDRYSYSKNNTVESLRWFEHAYELGDKRVLVDLAYGFSADSNAAHIDMGKAFKYAMQGALADDKYCQYLAGHLYLKGHGTERNISEAVKWLASAAEQDVTIAIEELAAVYMKGYDDFDKDYTQAFKWCTKGAATIAFCQTALGDMYRNGWGVDRNYQKAFEYYQTAASQPDSPHYYAQHMLGEMFLNGEGVPQDLAVAREWFQIAASQGYEPSRHKLQILAASHLPQNPPTSRQTNGAPAASSTTNEPPKKTNRWSVGFFGRKK